jgi:hypothetical protein
LIADSDLQDIEDDDGEEREEDLDTDDGVETKPELVLLQGKSKKKTKGGVELTFLDAPKPEPAPEPADKAKPARDLKATMHALASTATSPAQKQQAYAKSPLSVGKGQQAIANPDSDASDDNVDVSPSKKRKLSEPSTPVKAKKEQPGLSQAKSPLTKSSKIKAPKAKLQALSSASAAKLPLAGSSSKRQVEKNKQASDE